MSEIKKLKAKVKYKLRGHTIDKWQQNNPTLDIREPGLILNKSGKTVGVKIGDGITSWNDLDIFNSHINSKIISKESSLTITNMSPLIHNIKAKIYNKNLFDLTQVINNQSSDGLQFTNNSFTFIKNKYVTETNNISYVYSDIYLKSGTYYISGQVKQSDNQFGGWAIINNQTETNEFIADHSSDGVINGVFIINTSGTYRVCFYINYNSDDGVSATYSNIQIELGAHSTSYTSYVTDLSTVQVTKSGKNIIPYPYVCQTNSIVNGITYIVNDNGSITLNGKIENGQTAVIMLYGEIANQTILQNGETYTLSLKGSPNSSYIYLNTNVSDTGTDWQEGIVNTLDGDSTSNTVLINKDYNGFQLYLVIAGNYSRELNNVTVYPQLEIGSIVTDYEQYQDSQVVFAQPDGTINGLISTYPTMILKANNPNVLIGCEYCDDLNSDIQKTTTKISNCSNSLKATKEAVVLSIDDISPLKHELKVKLKSDVLTDFSSVKVLRYGKNIYDLYSESVKSLGGVNSFDTVSKNNGLLTITSDNKKITTQYHCPIFTLYEAELPKGTYTFSFKCGFENSVPTAAKPNYLAFYLGGVVNTADFLTDGSYNYTFNLENKAIIRIDFYKHVFYAQEEGQGSEYASDTIYKAKFWDIQLESGANATEYEDYKQVQEVTASANGNVDGLTSLSPNMTLLSDTENVIIECEYNKDINTLKFEGGGGSIEIDQTYNPESTNAQSGVALSPIFQKKIELWQPNTEYKVGDAVVVNTYESETDKVDTVIAICVKEHVSSDTNWFVIEQDGDNWAYNGLYAQYDSFGNSINNHYATKEELNSKFSAGLRREVIDNFIIPDMAEDNVIYMVPDSNATEDNNYLEYIKTKQKYTVADSQDYIYAKDETSFSIIYLRNGTFIGMTSDDYLDEERPQGAHLTFHGFNVINEIQEDITVTVDAGSSDLRDYILSLDLNGQSAIVNLGDALNEWDTTPDDDVMKSFGYLYRSQITYEILSERESMELIGSTAVDLSTYATMTYVGNAINSAIDKTYSASVNKKSYKAQSGIAVDAAITDGLKTIKTDINSLKSQMSGKLSRQIVEILPDVEQSISNRIYMLKNSSNNTDNIYDEYLPIVIKSEPIEFNHINVATILEADTGYDISENVDLMVEDKTFHMYYSSETGIWIDSPEANYVIILDTTILDQSTIDILNDIINWSGDYSKYPSITFSNYSNSQLGNLTFNTNKKVYELIGSTAVDLSDYPTKSEVNAQFEDANKKINHLSSISLRREIVNSLPSEYHRDINTIYMVPSSSTEDNNIYDEYLIIEKTYEDINVRSNLWALTFTNLEGIDISTEYGVSMDHAIIGSITNPDENGIVEIKFIDLTNENSGWIFTFHYDDIPADIRRYIFESYNEQIDDSNWIKYEFMISIDEPMNVSIAVFQNNKNAELIGSTAVDLSNYYTKAEIDNSAQELTQFIWSGVESDYYSAAQIDNMLLEINEKLIPITNDEINEICGTTILISTEEGVEF